MLTRHPHLHRAVVAGLGDFIAAEAARRIGLELIPLAERLGDAARTARRPRRAISERRSGTRLPRPPSKMAMDDRFAKPQRAKVTITWVSGVSDSLIAARLT